jgi:hypothetical protein
MSPCVVPCLRKSALRCPICLPGAVGGVGGRTPARAQATTLPGCGGGTSSHKSRRALRSGARSSPWRVLSANPCVFRVHCIGCHCSSLFRLVAPRGRPAVAAAYQAQTREQRRLAHDRRWRVCSAHCQQGCQGAVLPGEEALRVVHLGS